MQIREDGHPRDNRVPRDMAEEMKRGKTLSFLISQTRYHIASGVIRWLLPDMPLHLDLLPRQFEETFQIKRIAKSPCRLSKPTRRKFSKGNSWTEDFS